MWISGTVVEVPLVEAEAGLAEALEIGWVPRGGSTTPASVSAGGGCLKR